MNLYNTARQNAASTQRSGGIPLERLGLDDIPDAAPPEYAPPVPALPGGKYQAPSRPVSEFASAEPSLASGMNSPDLANGTSPAKLKGGVVLAAEASGSQAVDAGSSPAAAGPSTSGLTEKEQMRRYYEAKDKVENRGEASGSGSGSGSGSAPPAVGAIPGLSEKEQMKRYYEAKDKVDRVEASGSSRPVASSPIASAPSAPVSEQEQMQRYYEARDRVEQTQQGAFAPGGSASGSGINGAASGSGSGSDAPLAPALTPSCPSAADEKDMMRKRYEEAANRVNRAGTASPPMMDSPPSFSPAIVSGPSSLPSNGISINDIPSNSAGPSTSYPSATDEKERMRRLYEDANQRVSRARQSLSPPPPDSPTPQRTTSTVPFASSPSYTSSPQIGIGPSPDAGPSGSGSAYPTAEQEKEAMRNRYDAATSAVSRRAVSGGMGNGGVSGGMGNGEGSGSIKGGGRVGSGLTEEELPPPPPLPSRPPAEYINLLSPVGEAPEGFGRFR